MAILVASFMRGLFLCGLKDFPELLSVLSLSLTTEYPFMRHIPCVGVVSPKPGWGCAKTPFRRTSDCSVSAKPGLLPAAAITGTGHNDTSVQSQPPNGDHAMRAADRDPAGGERPMELTAISRLMISSKRGSRKNSLYQSISRIEGKPYSIFGEDPPAQGHPHNEEQERRGTGDGSSHFLRRKRWRNEK